MHIATTSKRWARQGVSAVELALLLPFLMFLFVLVVDFCRVFYYTITVENCARNGALWASDQFAQTESPYASVTDASQADFPVNKRTELIVRDPVQVITIDGVNYVEAMCSYTFSTITSYPGISGPWTIQRAARARVVPPR